MTQTHVHTPHALSSPLEDHVNPPSPSYINYPSTLPENLAPSPSINEDKSTKYIVAAVVQSIVAGFSLVAMFFLCCLETRRNKIEPKETQKNENPPVGFCTSPGSVSANDNAGLSEKIYGNLPLPPGRTAPSLPAAPAPPPPKPPAPPPPPPPKAGRYPNSRPTKPSSLGPDCGRGSSAGESNELCDQSEAPKTKLKPFFWDKVVASPDHSMVWHEIEAGSFQFDEAMIENLFGYVQSDKNKNERRKDSLTSDPQIIQIIDARKSHNLAILLRALNVTTDEVCDALNKGNELPAEFIQPLLKMAPTSEEELNLRSYNGDISHLGPADRFLKAIVNIPFAFKRLESLLFITTFQEEVSSIKETLATLEVACKELRNSRLFLKLLEAILKTGNRMNDGTYRGGAQAFKLDTLLKLSDVKGTDGKTTLLHFVVQEIIRSEGLRAVRQLKESQSLSEDSDYHRTLGLQVISGLSNELEDVKRAALFDNENLKASVSKLGRSLENTREFFNNEMKSLEGNNEFHDVLASFVTRAELDVVNLVQEEERITALVKITGDYFYGSREGNDDCSRLFVIVRDFLLMLDKACKDVQNSIKFPSKTTPRNEPSHSLGSSHHESLPYYRKQLFPAMRERQMGDNHSSDDES